MNITLKLVNPETYKICDQGDLGVFFDGELESTYNIHEIPLDRQIIEMLLEDAFEHGKEAGRKEIKDAFKSLIE